MCGNVNMVYWSLTVNGIQWAWCVCVCVCVNCCMFFMRAERSEWTEFGGEAEMRKGWGSG